MDFVYLHRTDDPKHGSSLTFKDVSIGPTALLRARTFIAILSDKQMLNSISIGDEWLIYYPSFDKPFIDKVSIGMQPESVVGIIPVLPFKQIWEQPGMFAIRSSLEIQTLFNETFLSFSKKWITDNPSKVEEVYRNIETLVKA